MIAEPIENIRLSFKDRCNALSYYGWPLVWAWFEWMMSRSLKFVESVRSSWSWGSHGRFILAHVTIVSQTEDGIIFNVWIEQRLRAVGLAIETDVGGGDLRCDLLGPFDRLRAGDEKGFHICERIALRDWLGRRAAEASLSSGR